MFRALVYALLLFALGYAFRLHQEERGVDPFWLRPAPYAPASPQPSALPGRVAPAFTAQEAARISEQERKIQEMESQLQKDRSTLEALRAEASGLSASEGNITLLQQLEAEMRVQQQELQDANREKDERRNEILQGYADEDLTIERQRVNQELALSRLQERVQQERAKFREAGRRLEELRALGFPTDALFAAEENYKVARERLERAQEEYRSQRVQAGVWEEQVSAARAWRGREDQQALDERYNEQVAAEQKQLEAARQRYEAARKQEEERQAKAAEVDARLKTLRNGAAELEVEIENQKQVLRQMKTDMG